MALLRFSFAAAAALALSACFTPPPDNLAGDQPPPVVDRVDLDRYLGRWFEIARYDMAFERGCDGVTANYSRREDGLIRVINTCRQGGLDGELEIAEGRARVVEGSNGAKLKVSFFGPFWGDYWVLELDEAYEWVVVGGPEGRYLWILSRTPQMDAAVLDARLQRLEQIGYDTSELIYPDQWESVEAAPDDAAEAG